MSEFMQPLRASPFQSCPVEIVRQILEYAAQTTAAGAYTLALVSKDVRDWINPILYQTLVISKPDHLEAIITNSISISGSSKFLCQHVHNLAFVWFDHYTVSPWDDDVVQGIVWLLRECQNLRTLLIDFYLPQLESLVAALPRLTHIHSEAFLDVGNITHIYLSDVTLGDHDLFATLTPRVSHVGFRTVLLYSYGVGTVLGENLLSSVLQKRSIIKLVVVLSFEPSIVFQIPNEPPFTDTRLCLLKADENYSLLKDWEREARGGPSLWDRENEGKSGTTWRFTQPQVGIHLPD